MNDLIKFSLILLATPTVFAHSINSDAAKQIWAKSIPVLETKYLQENCPLPCALPQSISSNSANLNKAQIHAVNSYTMGTYVDLNLGLRTDDLSVDQLEFTRILDSALEKIPSEEAVAYRGTSKREFTVTGQPHQIVTLPAFTGTVSTQQIAEAYIKNRLQIMKLKSGKNIQPYSRTGRENELLLPRNSHFRIDHVQTKVMNLVSEENGSSQAEVEVVHMTEI